MIAEVLLAPFARELGEAFLGRGLGRRCVDRAQISGHFVPVLAGGIAERVADQVHDAGLDDSELPDRGDGLGQALEPVADRDADVLDAAVFDFGQYREPELCSFAAVPGPQPEDVAFAVDGDADSDVDRPVGDLPVADQDERSRR